MATKLFCDECDECDEQIGDPKKSKEACEVVAQGPVTKLTVVFERDQQGSMGFRVMDLCHRCKVKLIERMLVKMKERH